MRAAIGSKGGCLAGVWGAGVFGGVALSVSCPDGAVSTACASLFADTPTSAP